VFVGVGSSLPPPKIKKAITANTATPIPAKTSGFALRSSAMRSILLRFS